VELCLTNVQMCPQFTFIKEFKTLLLNFLKGKNGTYFILYMMCLPLEDIKSLKFKACTGMN
jgi:hypothetical protein